MKCEKKIVEEVLRGFSKDMSEPISWILMKGKIQEALKLQREEIFKELLIAKQCVHYQNISCDNKSCINYLCILNRKFGEELKQKLKEEK